MDEQVRNLEQRIMQDVQAHGGTMDLDFANDLHYEYYREQLRNCGANIENTPHLINLLETERSMHRISATAIDPNPDGVEGPNDASYIEVPAIFRQSSKELSDSENDVPDSTIYVSSIAKYCKMQRSVIIQSTVKDELRKRNITDTGIYDNCFEAQKLVAMNTDSFYDGTPRKYTLISTFTSVSEDAMRCPQLKASCTVKENIAVNTDIIESYTVIDPKHKNSKGDHVLVSYNRDGYVPNFDYSYDNEPEPSRANPVRIRFMLDVSIMLRLKDGFTINGLHMNSAPVLTLDHPFHGVIKCYYYAGTSAPLVEISDDKRTATVSLPKVVGVRKGADWCSFLPFADLENTSSENLHIYGQFVFSVTQKTTGEPLTFPFPVSFRSEKGGSDYNAQNIQNEPIYMQWGCVGKDTMIMRSDERRTAVRISDLQIGDFVITADARERRIVNILTGTDETILSITTETGRNILLTTTHSIKSEDGWITAGELCPGMKVVCENGLETVEQIVEQIYDDTVYNLHFEEETAIFGNGFVIGDFDMQQRIKPQREELSIDWSPATLSIAREIDSLAEKMKESTV